MRVLDVLSMKTGELDENFLHRIILEQNHCLLLLVIHSFIHFSKDNDAFAGDKFYLKQLSVDEELLVQI